jgi:hypothetical protein
MLRVLFDTSWAVARTLTRLHADSAEAQSVAFTSVAALLTARHRPPAPARAGPRVATQVLGSGGGLT